jgi:hypothetical protein
MSHYLIIISLQLHRYTHTHIAHLCTYIHNILAQAMQSDPEIMRAMQNPEIMAKLQQIQSNPAAAMQLMQDPQLASIIMKLQQAMGGGGGGGGGGMMSSFGNTSSSSSSSSTGKSGNVIQITNGSTQLNELIQQSKTSKKLLAIDYYTTWCGMYT